MMAFRSRENRRLLRFSAGLFLIYLLMANPAPDPPGPILHLGVSLVDQRSVALPSYRESDVARYKGRFLSGHPPGASFLVAGVYQVFRPLFPAKADDRTIFWLNALSVALISLPLAVLAAAVFFQMLRTIPASPAAAGWTLILMGLGTASFAYSGAFYKKAIAGSVILLAISLVWPRPEEVRRENLDKVLAPMLLFFLGLLVGFCVVLDYPMILWIPFLLVYLLRRKAPPAGFVSFLFGGAIMAGVLFLYHQAAFGHPLRTSYTFRFHPGDAPYFLGFDPIRLFQILIGTQCGLFLYTPALFLSAIGWWVAVRRRILRDEMIWLIGAPSVTYALFYAFWSSGYWCGGEALSVRMMMPLFPLILLPAAVGIEKTPSVIWVPLAVLSLVFAFLGAQAFYFPAASVPVVNALKNAVASLGAGELFSRFLPRLVGIETPLSIPGGKVSHLFSEPGLLLRLMSAQLVFAAVQFALIAGIWRMFLRDVLQSPWEEPKR